MESRVYDGTTHDRGQQGAVVDASDRQWAALAHLSALVLALMTSWIAGLAGVLGAGAIYLLKRNDSAFVAEHAREAINFNLSMFIYACAAVAIGIVLVGATVLTLGLGIILTAPAGLLLLLAVAAIAVVWLVCSIIATVKAWNGETYRYPFTLRLF
ncbi:MAG: DUF4870 domain-containing protein [Luteimonas sp.]|nr:DUF4870 domain-containing protein [Luteimonas sp.]